MTKSKYLTYLFVLTIFSMQGLACLINYFIDFSHQWSDYDKLAKLAINGKTVAVPRSYNEREFQHQIIRNLQSVPNTIVIGSSRGMYLGKEILNSNTVYNHCVSGGNLFDYFAILGLYKQYCDKIPDNIIFEVSPWVFSDVSPEGRWTENYYYRIAAIDFYKFITDKNQVFIKYFPFKSPVFSFTYMYTNITNTLQNCIKYGYKKGLKINDFLIQESNDEKEQADLPDGVIRYPFEVENKNEGRTKKVKDSSNGAVKYQNCDEMKSLSNLKYNDFKSLILWLKMQNVNMTFFLAPFSRSQSEWIYKKNSNPVFLTIEKQLLDLSKELGIRFIGGYNADKFNLSDDEFSDFMHGDKESIYKVWNYRE